MRRSASGRSDLLPASRIEYSLLAEMTVSEMSSARPWARRREGGSEME